MFFRAENTAFHERPTFWFFITVAFEIVVARIELMRLMQPPAVPLRRRPAVQRMRLSAPTNVRLRRRQVGVDVVDAVDVAVVEELRRAGDVPRQPLVDRDVASATPAGT